MRGRFRHFNLIEAIKDFCEQFINKPQTIENIMRRALIAIVAIALVVTSTFVATLIGRSLFNSSATTLAYDIAFIQKPTSTGCPNP